MERFYSFAVVIKGRNYKIRQADVLKELHWKDGLGFIQFLLVGNQLS